MARVKHTPVRPVKWAAAKPEVLVKRLSQKKEVVVSSENLARAYTEEKKQEKEETTDVVFEGDKKSISLFTHCIQYPPRYFYKPILSYCALILSYRACMLYPILSFVIPIMFFCL